MNFVIGYFFAGAEGKEIAFDNNTVFPYDDVLILI